jgi:hypothetical protein
MPKSSVAPDMGSSTSYDPLHSYGYPAGLGGAERYLGMKYCRIAT